MIQVKTYSKSRYYLKAATMAVALLVMISELASHALAQEAGQGDNVMEQIFEPPVAPIPAQAENANQPTTTETEILPADAELNDVTLEINEAEIAPPETTIDEDIYFDANDLIPDSELSTEAPRRINPQTEPASSFVVVNKDYTAGSTPAKLIAAQRAMSLGRYEAALDIYTELQGKFPKGPKTLLGKAVALQHLQREDEAIETYQKLLDIDPDNIDAHINMLGLVSQKYPAVALQRLENLRKKHPENLEIIGQVAFVQAQIGRYEGALKNFGVIASQEPQNAAHILNMAIVADKADMKQQAIAYYERALELDTIYGGGRSIAREQIFDRLATMR